MDSHFPVYFEKMNNELSHKKTCLQDSPASLSQSGLNNHKILCHEEISVFYRTDPKFSDTQALANRKILTRKNMLRTMFRNEMNTIAVHLIPTITGGSTCVKAFGISESTCT